MISGSFNSSTSSGSLSASSAVGGLQSKEDSAIYQNVREDTNSASVVVSLSEGVVVAPVTPSNEARLQPPPRPEPQDLQKNPGLVETVDDSADQGASPAPEQSAPPKPELLGRAPNTVKTSPPTAKDVNSQQAQALLADEIRNLKSRDREVRQHEQAHASRGGVHAGTPNYDFTTGPDGVRYATGGEVAIDVSAEPGDPQATLEKARDVRAAALAPRSPSPQDRSVASEAGQLAAQAQVELLQLKRAAADEAAPERRPDAAEDQAARRSSGVDAEKGQTVKAPSRSDQAQSRADVEKQQDETDTRQQTEEKLKTEQEREARRQQLRERAQQKNQANALERYQEIFGSLTQDTQALTKTASSQQLVSQFLDTLA